MYNLIQNNTNRAFPEKADSMCIIQLAKRRNGESVGFDCGGDFAVILDADGKTLAQYEYRERFFSTESYLNG
jgi:hypothetical protein